MKLKSKLIPFLLKENVSIITWLLHLQGLVHMLIFRIGLLGGGGGVLVFSLYLTGSSQKGKNVFFFFVEELKGEILNYTLYVYSHFDFICYI